MDLTASDDLTVAQDLTTEASDLSATVDLALPPAIEYDLSWSSCAGTAIAGTCVAAFFDSFAACFQPSGHCRAGSHNGGVIDDWDDGVRYATSYWFGLHASSYGYSLGNTSCLQVVSYRFNGGPPTINHYCRPSDNPCTDDPNSDTLTAQGGAFYDLTTGIFTCPDNTQVDVGAKLGDCPLLNSLLSPEPLCDGLRPLF